MKHPDPNCEQCGGTGKFPAIALDIHGDGFHTCFCAIEEPKEIEEMTIEELREELKMWHEGDIYRGYDRIQALKVPQLEAQAAEYRRALEELFEYFEKMRMGFTVGGEIIYAVRDNAKEALFQPSGQALLRRMEKLEEVAKLADNATKLCGWPLGFKGLIEIEKFYESMSLLLIAVKALEALKGE